VIKERLRRSLDYLDDLDTLDYLALYGFFSLPDSLPLGAGFDAGSPRSELRALSALPRPADSGLPDEPADDVPRPERLGDRPDAR
jgi:hypothetical protein